MSISRMKSMKGFYVSVKIGMIKGNAFRLGLLGQVL